MMKKIAFCAAGLAMLLTVSPAVVAEEADIFEEAVIEEDYIDQGDLSGELEAGQDDLSEIQIAEQEETYEEQESEESYAEVLISGVVTETAEEELTEAEETGFEYEDVFTEWNGRAKSLETLIEYVEDVTNETSGNFIPEIDRIAVFDMDGTLYGELFPTYLEYYMLAWRILKDPSIEPDDEMLALGEELRESVISNSFAEDMPVRHAIQAARAYAGMTLNEFSDFVTEILLRDVDGFEGMTYGEAFYLPMLEVIEYLCDNNFKVYIVSGSDRFICRTLFEGIVDIPDERIIGMDVELDATGQNGEDGLDYVYSRDDEVVRTDRLLIKNLKMNKVRQIAQEIGRAPVLSFGNSSGDVSMHNFTLNNKNYKSAAFMLIADDEERDYGNAQKAEELRTKWEDSGFNVISMRDDFRTIYGDDVVKTGIFRWADELAGGRDKREMPAAEEGETEDDAAAGEDKVLYVTANRLNVRDAASTDGKVLGTVNRGDKVKVIGAAAEKGWYKIDYNGKEAYVSASYLSEEG